MASDKPGNPYNYQFDFRIESALVCSQLICKAYESIPGLQLQPKMSGGRLLYSPNEFAIKFDRERDTPNNEMDLVLFVDGLFVDGRGIGEKTNLPMMAPAECQLIRCPNDSLSNPNDGS